MDLVNENLINSVIDLNNTLKSKFSYVDKLDKNTILPLLRTNGKLMKLNKLEENDLKKFTPMACVDGSVNRFGGSFPHYIDLYQGLGKISGNKISTETRAMVYCPLISNSLVEDDPRQKLLSKIEVETAIDIIEKHKIGFLLMDGNLIRYMIDVPEQFQVLKSMALEKDIILAGFIKEAKSTSLTRLFFENEDSTTLYDKDLLYGVLSYGEGFILNEFLNKKINQGISSMFLRTSNHPGISAIEVIKEQESFLELIGCLSLTLTSKMSRGVPMIIDLVDREARIDDKLAEELIKTYIDKDIFERLFRSERSMRRY